MINNLLIDFDSTIISCEIMEVLAEISLKNKRNKDSILQNIRDITDLGMIGQIPFSQSLDKRIRLLPITRLVIDESIDRIRKNISPSFKNNVSELKKYNIHILSGAFTDIILPLMEEYGFTENNIHAIDLIFDNEQFIGVDKLSPLAQNEGKVIVAQRLNLKNDTLAIGDGITDYQIKNSGLAKYFYYYNEHVTRPEVIKLADETIENFDDLINKLKTN